MKRLFTFLFVAMAAVTIGCTQNPEPAKADVVMTFTSLEHDYGTITQGADGSCEFEFKNTGKEPLIISNAQASCGCTVPEWPKDPIAKGKTGVIKVKYNTNNMGSFSKSITITSNANNSPIVLHIKGTVTAKEQPKEESKESTTTK